MKTRLGRISKILAVLLGSMVASVSFHLALSLWVGKDYIVPTSIFSFIILWVAFMVLVHWIEKPWKSWAWLLLIIAVSGIAIYLGLK
ncbi:MAG: hypothetical protein AAFU74_12365 [Bacteroidota bacterium]